MQQAALPATADFSERLMTLAHCCPVLHKLGQILARDQRLALSLRRQLQKLESLPCNVPDEIVQSAVDAELGPAERNRVTLQFPAIAEASVAIVVPYIDNSGKSGNVDSVFKILKPGIEEQLAAELALLTNVGAHLDQRCDELSLPHLNYEEVFRKIQEKLAQEVLLGQEQFHLKQAARLYSDDSSVQIPALRTLCTPRLTAMERIYGVKVTDHRLKCRSDRERIAAIIARALLATPIYCRESATLFHADPHAGNLFFTGDSRLAVLDWSLVGYITDAQRLVLARIMQLGLALDPDGLTALLESLAVDSRYDRRAIYRVCVQRIARIRRGMLPGVDWLLGLMDDAVQTAKLQVESELMLFRKSLHVLEGVVAEVAPGVTLDTLLLREFWRHFAAEWPWRWCSSPLSRDFSTRLSTWDVCAVGLSFPLTAARYWQGLLTDVLGTRGSRRLNAEKN